MNENTTNFLKKPRICFIVTIFSIADAFLKDHIEALSEYYDVYLVADFTEDDLNKIVNLKLTGYKIIHIKRDINIIDDIKAVIELYKYFKKNKFYSVHSVSPKAGLVTSLAGAMAKVSNRIHIFTGQVWATKKGVLRYLLITFDWLIVKLNTRILVDGESQRQYLIKHKIVNNENSIVIGDGSIVGVNTERFNPKKEVRDKIRLDLKISETQIVYVFLGRLNKDKGIDELLSAFNSLVRENKNAYLLLVGVDEDDYMSRIQEFTNIKQNINFKYYGKTPNPEILLQAGDVFCLPTYREGFGMSVIEASCLGLPVICSDTYGVLDAMVDNVTGLRCKVQDVDSLYYNMKQLFLDSDLRVKLGLKGRERVLDRFSSKFITNEWVKFYSELR